MECPDILVPSYAEMDDQQDLINARILQDLIAPSSPHDFNDLHAPFSTTDVTQSQNECNSFKSSEDFSFHITNTVPHIAKEDMPNRLNGDTQPSNADLAETSCRRRDPHTTAQPMTQRAEMQSTGHCTKQARSPAGSIASERNGRQGPGLVSSGTFAKLRRPRRTHISIPSRFCHICARTQKSRKVVCSNIASGRCRKAVCELCFNELSWDFETVVAVQHLWKCPHCVGVCSLVPRARCHIYKKTNDRRRNMASARHGPS